MSFGENLENPESFLMPIPIGLIPPFIAFKINPFDYLLKRHSRGDFGVAEIPSQTVIKTGKCDLTFGGIIYEVMAIAEWETKGLNGETYWMNYLNSGLIPQHLLSIIQK